MNEQKNNIQRSFFYAPPFDILIQDVIINSKVEEKYPRCKIKFRFSY